MSIKKEPENYVCEDPENCDKEHNPETSMGEVHHYGCECDECVQFYWSLKH